MTTLTALIIAAICTGCGYALGYMRGHYVGTKDSLRKIGHAFKATEREQRSRNVGGRY